MGRLNEYFRPTRFADVTVWQSRLILSAFVIIIIWGTAFCSKPFSTGRTPNGTTVGDAKMYRSILNRVHAGEDYYEVVGNELRTRGYATRPFFNWRPPLLAWFVGKMLTPEIGRWILMLLALTTFVLWLSVLSKEGGFYMTLLGGLLLLGTVVSCFTDTAFLFHEVWAGILIAFSIAVYMRNRALSVVSGLLALFIRELSLPFTLVMLIIAYRQGRRREAVVWLIGITAFFLYLTIHAKIVAGLLTDSDVAGNSWVRFGGWSFVLATAKWTLLTFLTPLWFDAILLPIVLLGVLGWRGDVGTRLALTVILYVFVFSIAGREDNHYWGLIYAPLIPLGLIYAPLSLVDLWKAAVGIRK